MKKLIDKLFNKKVPVVYNPTTKVIDYDLAVSIVESWFDNEPVKNKNMFVNSKEDALVVYHHTLGRSIRNEFKLWQIEWTPEIENGIDVSNDHPDQVSMIIITKLWKKLNDQ